VIGLDFLSFILLDYGDYRGGEAGPGTLDTRKLWVTLAYTYQ
jgi:hypothetical protein